MQSHRASSLFQPSNLARALQQTMDPTSGAPRYLYGSIMAFPHTMVARTLAVLGMDFIMVDALHTPLDAENLVRIIHTINFCSEGKTVAVVRVPSAHSDLLTHALDAGKKKALAELAQRRDKLTLGCLHAPLESSSHILTRPKKQQWRFQNAGITDIAPASTHDRVADAHIAVICQIESQLALDNADAIAATPGVDSLMLGPGDLRLSLGLPARKIGERDDVRFLNAIEHLIGVRNRHCKPLMTVIFKVSAEEDTWVKHFNLLLTTADFINVVRGHQADLATAKSMIANMVKTDKSDKTEDGVMNGGGVNGRSAKVVDGVELNGHAGNGVEQNGHLAE